MHRAINNGTGLKCFFRVLLLQCKYRNFLIVGESTIESGVEEESRESNIPLAPHNKLIPH